MRHAVPVRLSSPGAVHSTIAVVRPMVGVRSATAAGRIESGSMAMRMTFWAMPPEPSNALTTT